MTEAERDLLVARLLASQDWRWISRTVSRMIRRERLPPMPEVLAQYLTEWPSRDEWSLVQRAVRLVRMRHYSRQRRVKLRRGRWR